MPRALREQYGTLSGVSGDLASLGVQFALVKMLPFSQDNSKNQIYLGKGLSLSQFFPGTLAFRGLSTSAKKDRSAPGEAITELRMDFSWVYPGAKGFPAPKTRLIEYSQYPECRLSGFLDGCEEPPDALRHGPHRTYGQRALLLGLTSDEVFGIVVTERESPALIRELQTLPQWPIHRMFGVLDVSGRGESLDPEKLLSEVMALAGHPHAAQTLRANETVPTLIPGGGQVGGWTLEALLGIPRNSQSAPDKHGLELKSVGSSKVSLITTEPDLGERHESFARYLDRFGWESPVRPGYRVLNGPFYFGRSTGPSGLQLTIDHWDSDKNYPDGSGDPTVMLMHIPTDTVVSGWSFANLGAHWSRKHSGAMYVQSTPLYTYVDGMIRGGRMMHEANVRGLRPTTLKPSHYYFGPQVALGLGTSVIYLLQAIGAGTVHLDPGDRIDPAGRAQRRTQWRTQGSLGNGSLLRRLEPLYDRFREISVGPNLVREELSFPLGP